ncbi:MAG: TauD/TfdA family dioxygenase [Pseudomonadota bacterium]
MINICRQPINHPSAWKASDYASPDDYAFDLGPRHFAAFDQALENIHRQGLTLDDVEKKHFEVPEIAGDIKAIFDEIQSGRGFVLVRGFPLERYSEEEISLIYWGLGTHMGRGVSQSVMGDRLGHVMDHSQNDPNARAYRNKQDLSLHTDLSEIVSLLSLACAKTGGLSQFASVVSIHNEILKHHPEYLEPLYEGFRYYRAGEEGPGEDPVTPWNVPVLAYKDGLISARYVRSYLENGAEVLGQPLSELQRRALDYFDEVARREDVMLEFLIEPGQAVFQNNYVVLHARSAFEDDMAAGYRRHLLRLWLDVPDGRPAPQEMELHTGPGIGRQEGKRPSGEGDAYKALVKG